MGIYIRDLHNHMIKPSNNGGLVSVADYMIQKLLISDTVLRSFIPPQAWKMTTKLRQICRCEICIIPKDLHIYFNRSRTILVIYLQQKSANRNLCNSLFTTTSDSH